MKSYISKEELSQKIEEIHKGKEAIFNLPGIVDHRLNFFSSFFFRLLSHYNISYLSEMILVILKEITGNCTRATAKRLYFKEHNYDITNPDTYKEKLIEFKDYISEDWDDFIAKYQESEFYIKIKIHVDEKNLYFGVENNIEMLPVEKARVQHRIKSFFKFKNIDEAFGNIWDDSEGAGLGFFLMLSLLKNSRIPPENFKLASANGLTKHQIVIPLVTTDEKLKSRFFDKILSEIKILPSFPQNITAIIDMCQSNNATVQLIATEVQKDPALTAQVLKLVNSAGYMSRNRNPSLEDGVKIIGLRVLRDLLMVTGARRAIQTKYKLKELEEIWDNSNRVSFFARTLAKKFDVQVAEQATISGLLYALGKIVLVALTPKVASTVSELLGSSRVRTGSVVEEAMLGISSPEIGSRMAKSWNFPPQLTMAIKYQQRPLEAPEEYQKIVKCIYFAICINDTINKSSSYWHIDSEILEEFSVFSKSDFDKKVEELNAQYQSSQ